MKWTMPRTAAINLGEKGGGLPVAGVFRVVAVEGADLIRRLPRAVPAKVLLDGRLRGAVSLLAHHLLAAHDGELGAIRRGGTLSPRDAQRQMMESTESIATQNFVWEVEL